MLAVFPLCHHHLLRLHPRRPQHHTRPSRRSVQSLSTITSESGPLAVSDLGLKRDFQAVKNDKRDRHLTLDAVIEAPPKSRGKTIKETKAPTTKKTLEIDTALFAAKSFSELGLPPLLLERLQQAGFSSPTDIQSTAIPTILQNHDVVIQSYTGSGKTLAYLLPVLAEVGPLKSSSDEAPPKKREIEAVIVAPSRELGMQIVREVEKILGPSDKKLVQQLVGGANRSRQEEALKKNKPAIVVGTPGRIAEISAAGKLHTHSCRFLVLDEVDELLAFNFREDMHRILEHVGRRSGGDPNKGRDPQARKIERRTIMVSATVPFSVIRAARSWGENPVLVKAKSVSSLDSSSSPVLANSPGATPSPTSTVTTQQAQAASEGLPPNLKHFYCITKLQHKVDALRRCVHALDAQSVIVFMNHNRQLKDTVFKLQARGMNAAELHGDLSKLSRSTVLKKFKSGECRVLVTNELAARGLDVAECDLVVNLDLPTDSTHYAHRAGRTGRLGRKGIVVTICEQPEVFVVKKMERQLGVAIQACDFVEGKLLVTEKEEKP
ncbi:DEAD-box ATP-dependent RNA helicase 47B-like protein [Drosera capensis]